MSVWENQCVVGSADHGLKVFDIQNGKLLRELYTKKYVIAFTLTQQDMVTKSGLHV